ncbi:MAG: type II toxin-antitoxin system VapC family toxin [Pseudomonadota bacterium]
MTAPDGARVVDASVALKWVLDEPGSADAAGLLDGRALYAPPLLQIEAANALWVVTRRGGLSADEAADALDLLDRAPFRALPRDTDVTTDALRLAQLMDHPVYDCIYLALALRLKCPVVTADRRFVRAAKATPETAPFVQPLTAEPSAPH